MPKQTKPIPLKDTNQNGYLDSEELIAQLKAENEKGAIRTPNERVHGILEMAGIRAIAVVCMEEGKVKTLSEAKAQTATELFSRQLISSVQQAKNLSKTFTKEELKDRIRESAIQKGSSEERVQLNVADAGHSYDFAQSFSKVFPNGLRIKEDDIAEILGHFSAIEPLGKQRKSATPAKKTYPQI